MSPVCLLSLRRASNYRSFVLIAVAGVLLVPRNLRGQDNWVQQSPATFPTTRVRASMAYDPLHLQTVLFGGADALGSTVYGDTWLWDGNTWSPTTPANSPSARRMSAMAYDATRQQEVLFGGEDATNALTGDTWVWDGSNWTQKNPASAPSARRFHAMAYDALHQQLVLFGGITAVSGTIVVVGDTWVWDGSNWTQMSPSTSPSARSGHVMAYDTARQRVVLFGGVGGLASNSTIFGDTWVWDGSNWTQETPATSPPAREVAVMTYDDTNQRSLLFGGTTSPIASSSTILGDTWAWDGTNWTQLMPAASPPARINAQLAYDSAHEQAILFGGLTVASGVITGFSDTWLFGSGAQTQVTINVPASVQFTFNGTAYTGSQTINIAPGTYSLSTASPQSTGPGSQVVFVSWSDAPGQSHSVSVGATAITITGTYNTQYQLTTNASPAAGGSVSPLTGFYDANVPLGVTAVANGGYAFASWSGACSGNGSCTVPMSGPTPVTANFAATGALVTINVPAGIQFSLNGTTYTGSQTVVLAPGSYPLSTSSPQLATPLSQVRFVSWSDNGGQSHQLVVAASMTVTGTFETQYVLTAIASPANEGTVTPLIPGPFYDEGTLVIVEATPNAGAEFDFWGGDCSGSSVACLVTMSQPHQVVAHFGVPQNWVQLFPSKSPPPRSFQAMAYDAGHHLAVIFGGIEGLPFTNGSNNVPLGDTWLSDGITWSQLTGKGPSVRWGAMMAYDANHNQIILFGGRPDNTLLPSAGLSDTWALDLGTGVWTLKSLSGPARYEASMAFDPQIGKVLLFGGLTGALTLSDTWAWNGSNWILVNQSGPRRAGAAMTYDAAHQKLVLFGGGIETGLDGLVSYSFNNVYVWNGTSWVEQGPAVHPPPLQSPSMAYNSATEEVLVFGENVANDGTVSSQTWAWDGNNFYQRMPVSTPSARVGQTMVFGSVRQEVLLFGGADDTTARPMNDTWAWLTPTVGLFAQTPIVTISGNNYVVTIPLTNSGNVPDSLILGSVTLGSAASAGIIVSTINPGSTVNAVVKFKISSVPGTSAVATITGSYIANGVIGIPWSANFVVPLP